MPVLPCRATLVYEGGELKRIEEGRRLTGTPQTTAGTPITATTALMRFYAGLSERMDICSEVREIEIAYTLSNALGGPISLIPVWHITTDTEIYELNTLDGAWLRQAPKRQSGRSSRTRPLTCPAGRAGAGQQRKKEIIMFSKESPIGIIDSGIGGFAWPEGAEAAPAGESGLSGDGPTRPMATTPRRRSSL